MTPDELFDIVDYGLKHSSDEMAYQAYDRVFIMDVDSIIEDVNQNIREFNGYEVLPEDVIKGVVEYSQPYSKVRLSNDGHVLSVTFLNESIKFLNEAFNIYTNQQRLANAIKKDVDDLRHGGQGCWYIQVTDNFYVIVGVEASGGFDENDPQYVRDSDGDVICTKIAYVDPNKMYFDYEDYLMPWDKTGELYDNDFGVDKRDYKNGFMDLAKSHIKAAVQIEGDYKRGIALVESKKLNERIDKTDNRKTGKFLPPFAVAEWDNDQDRDEGFSKDVGSYEDMNKAIEAAEAAFYDHNEGGGSVEVYDKNDEVVYGLYEEKDLILINVPLSIAKRINYVEDINDFLAYCEDDPMEEVQYNWPESEEARIEELMDHMSYQGGEYSIGNMHRILGKDEKNLIRIKPNKKELGESKTLNEKIINGHHIDLSYGAILDITDALKEYMDNHNLEPSPDVEYPFVKDFITRNPRYKNRDDISQIISLVDTELQKMEEERSDPYKNVSEEKKNSLGQTMTVKEACDLMWNSVRVHFKIKDVGDATYLCYATGNPNDYDDGYVVQCRENIGGANLEGKDKEDFLNKRIKLDDDYELDTDDYPIVHAELIDVDKVNEKLYNSSIKETNMEETKKKTEEELNEDLIAGMPIYKEFPNHESDTYWEDFINSDDPDNEEFLG